MLFNSEQEKKELLQVLNSATFPNLNAQGVLAVSAIITRLATSPVKPQEKDAETDKDTQE